MMLHGDRGEEEGGGGVVVVIIVLLLLRRAPPPRASSARSSEDRPLSLGLVRGRSTTMVFSWWVVVAVVAVVAVVVDTSSFDTHSARRHRTRHTTAFFIDEVLPLLPRPPMVVFIGQ